MSNETAGIPGRRELTLTLVEPSPAVRLLAGELMERHAQEHRLPFHGSPHTDPFVPGKTRIGETISMAPPIRPMAEGGRHADVRICDDVSGVRLSEAGCVLPKDAKLEGVLGSGPHTLKIEFSIATNAQISEARRGIMELLHMLNALEAKRVERLTEADCRAISRWYQDEFPFKR